MRHHLLTYFLPLALLALGLAGCQSPATADASPAHPQEQPADENQEHAPAAEGEEVHLSHAQIEAAGIAWAPMSERPLKKLLKVNGYLELPAQNKATVGSMATGMVRQILVRPGQQVRPGQALLTLENPDFVAWQQDYLEKTARLAFVEADLERQTQLLAQEATGRKALEAVRSEREVLRAQLQGLRQKMALLGLPEPRSGQAFATQIEVKSPIGGFVRQIKVNTGHFVQPSEELFEVVDNHHIHADFMVFEKDLPYLREGQLIRFQVQGRTESLTAKVFAIGKAVEEKERAVRVHAEIDNKAGLLLPGMYVAGSIILDEAAVPALPGEAIAMDNGLPYIFVVEAEMAEEVHFLKVQVLQGSSDLGYVEVTPLDALPEGAEIVTEGAYFLMAQGKKGQMVEGHSH